MADTERISQPSLGSNELGAETNDAHVSSRVPAGSDTQLQAAIKSKGKNKENSNDKDDNVNDDETVFKNADDDEFFEADETEE